MKRLTKNVKPNSTNQISSIIMPINRGHYQKEAILLIIMLPRSFKSTVISPDHSLMTTKRIKHSIKLKLSQMGRSSIRERMQREHLSSIVDRSKRFPTSSSS